MKELKYGVGESNIARNHYLIFILIQAFLRIGRV